jgi:hypothetical protein
MIPDHDSSTPIPSGVISPIPVITTRLSKQNLLARKILPDSDDKSIRQLHATIGLPIVVGLFPTGNPAAAADHFYI